MMPVAQQEDGVGERVRFVRAQVDLDQEQFAARLGVAAKQNVSHWETTGKLSLKGARAIRRETGYGLDFLFYGDVSTLNQAQMRAWNDWRAIH